jgi:membrane peptidoglycan carboxypeptidase
VEVGPERVVEMAHRLGIRSRLPAVCAITLGSVAVNPLEMTNAYATLAAEGRRFRPNPLLRVRSPGGRNDPSVERERNGVQAVEPNVANLVTYALQDVVEYGTGASADPGIWPPAGKTGTAQDNVDAWFCGYTVQLAACVWVGFPQGQIPLEDIHGYSQVFGGTIPAAIWQDFMSFALTHVDAEPTAFPEPSFVNQTTTPSAEAPIPPPPSPSPEPSPEPSEEPSPSPSPEPPPSPSPSLPPTPTEPPPPEEPPGD